MAKKKDIQQPDIDLIQSEKVDIALIDNNTGQIPGVKKNPREMTEMEFKKLKQSLTKRPEYTAVSELRLFPFQGRFITIGGNMRLQAMKDLGWTKAIGKILPEDTPADKLNEWILLDNANYGKWDFDALANEWEQELLAEMNIDVPIMNDPEEEEEAKDDNCDPSALAPKEPVSRLGDIWELGAHRLVIGDSTEALYIKALMQGEVADCLITDPPYNVNYEDIATSHKHKSKNRTKSDIANDNLPEAQFIEFLTKAFDCAVEALKPGGAYYIWHADTKGWEFRSALRNAGLTLRQTIIWVKNSLILGRNDYQWRHEPCLYGWKDGASHFFTSRRDQSTVYDSTPDIESMTKEQLKDLVAKFYNGDIPTTAIYENKPLRNEEHPTMKPVPLIGRLIQNSSRWGDIILDVFGGSGTTLIAAEQLGRQCRMVEFDPIYGDVIVKRWEELTGQQARRIGNCLESAEKPISEHQTK